MRREHYAGRDLLRALTIEDLRRIARRRLPRSGCEYLEGGAEDELSLKRNRDVFERIAWAPRTLVGVAMPDLAVPLFGKRANMPVAIAPTGFNGLLWPQGDVALARAAATSGIPFTLSTMANCSIETLARDAPGENWFQLYPLKDLRSLDRLVDRARDAGYGTLVVTTDVPQLGAREWDQRNYRAPAKLGGAALLDMLAHPGWMRRVLLPGGVPRFENLLEFLPAGGQGQSALLGVRYLATQLNPMFSWDDVARIRERWRGRLVLKGILSLDDARRAVDARRRRHRPVEPRRTPARFRDLGRRAAARRSGGAQGPGDDTRGRRLPPWIGRAQGGRARRARGDDRPRHALRVGRRRRGRCRARAHSAACGDGEDDDSARLPQHGRGRPAVDPLMIAAYRSRRFPSHR